MREKMLKLPPEFYKGQPQERFRRLAKALMTVPNKEAEPVKRNKKQTPRKTKAA